MIFFFLVPFFGLVVRCGHLDFEVFKSILDSIEEGKPSLNYHQYLIDNEAELITKLDQIKDFSPKYLLFNLQSPVDLLRMAIKFKLILPRGQQDNNSYISVFFNLNATLKSFFSFLLQAVLQMRKGLINFALKKYTVAQLGYLDLLISANSDLIHLLCGVVFPFRVPHLNWAFISITSHVIRLTNKAKGAVRSEYLNYFYTTLMNQVIEEYLYCILVDFKPIIEDVPLTADTIEERINSLPTTHQELLPKAAQLFDFITAKIANASLSIDENYPTDKMLWANLAKCKRFWFNMMILLDSKFINNAITLRSKQELMLSLQVKFPIIYPDEFKESSFQIIIVPANPFLKPQIYIHDILDKTEAIIVKSIYFSSNYKNLHNFKKVLKRLIRKYYCKGKHYNNRSESCGQENT